MYVCSRNHTFLVVLKLETHGPVTCVVYLYSKFLLLSIDEQLYLQKSDKLRKILARVTSALSTETSIIAAIMCIQGKTSCLKLY